MMTNENKDLKKLKSDIRPREFLKKIHPNQFSDSKVIEKINCSRELLDFSLSKLAEQNKHFDFEEFVRKLLEQEVCPSLIKETGPAAGGDGKVDTENYPVSSKKQDFWWYGLNKENDKWAFAISLRQDWKPKCNSDIKGIIETKRKYSKIFFITNQSIKNNKRLEYQDAKKKETGIDIIVFDKSWILDQALKPENQELLKLINITQQLTEKETGENDFKKIKKLEKVEKKLKDYSSKGIINQEVIDLATDAAILSRDLEENEETVVGKFERALRLSRKKKNTKAENYILYCLAWYYYWWLDDYENFECYYTEYEKKIITDKNLEEIMSLADLWNLAFAKNKENPDNIEDKTNTLLALLIEKEQSQSRVTQLKAMTRLCIIKITLNQDLENEFKSLIDIVNEAIKFKEYDFVSLAKMIEVMLPTFSENSYYNELFELVTEQLTTRKGEVQKAEMYLKKAKIYSSNKKYYDAINMFGKCLTLLYKEEAKGKLTEVYVNIGSNFESIGLRYAAKNYYIAATTMFMDIFLKENYLDPFSIKVVDEIIHLEINLGNVESAIEWFGIRNIFLVILSETNEETDANEQEEFYILSDIMISSMILNTKVEDFNLMNKIIMRCAQNNLETSELMAKYVIGEYDNKLLEETKGNKQKADELVCDLYKSTLINKLPMPFYINNNKSEIQSQLFGNKIKIKFKSTNLLHRFSEFIMALLENTFATMHSYKSYMRGDIIIELQEKNTGEFDVKYEFDGLDTYFILLDSIDMYDISVDNHKLITEISHKLLLNILAVNFIYDDFEQTIEKVFVDDKSFERSINHTNSLYNLNKIFGPEDNTEIKKYEITRTNQWHKDVEFETHFEETVDPFEDKVNIVYTKTENNMFENISHDKIYSSGMINCLHWDSAKWNGIMYLGDLSDYRAIKIGFLFKNEKGAIKVFQDLINYATKDDKEGKIIISFIKGIDNKRPYDYRVMITGKAEVPKDVNDNILVNSLARFHNMRCDNNKNISILEKVLSNGNNPSISILPMTLGENETIIPLWDYEIGIKGVTVKQAYEIGVGDREAFVFLGDENPIIPTGIEKPPISELLKIKNHN